MPEELTVLMSALQDAEPNTNAQPGTKVHRFRQPIPMPTYLIAIAVGHLESRQIGPRSRVWSEKELVDRAAFEFDQVCRPVPFLEIFVSSRNSPYRIWYGFRLKCS